MLPTLAWPDAIGAHTLAITDALRAAGIASDIYFEKCPTPSIRHQGRPITQLGSGKRDRVILYQSSIGSWICDLIAGLPEPVLVNYHNIAPASLVDPWEPAVGPELEMGRIQLRRLAEKSPLGIAVSEYNRRELEEAGFRHSAVAPLLIQMDGGNQAPDADLLGYLDQAKASGGIDLLFVGRLSPHKAPHDLIKMTAIYRDVYDADVRLHLVGSPFGVRYGDAIADFVSALGLDKSVNITGPVSAAALESYYRRADLFVSASEHEGFCVPIVEAMAHGVPVVASTAGPYGGGAVPETVGSAGILLDSKSPSRFAAVVDRVVHDQALRAYLQQAGMERAKDFSILSSTEKMVDLIKSAIN